MKKKKKTTFLAKTFKAKDSEMIHPLAETVKTKNDKMIVWSLWQKMLDNYWNYVCCMASKARDVG